MDKSIKISKLDAAKRQLEIAIRMYFFNEEPVSIHTLTAAAYNILRDINKKRKGQPMFIKDMVVEYIKPEHRKLIRRKINEAENFFKHADKDGDAAIDFNLGQTEMLIIDACSNF